jgi:hypothetical protein
MSSGVVGLEDPHRRTTCCSRPGPHTDDDPSTWGVAGASPSDTDFHPGANGMMIRKPGEIATTLKRALEIAGPVVIGIPVDYRDNHRLMEIVHPSALN